MIHDPSDEELYKLKVDLKTGETQSWVLPNDGSVKLDHVLTPPDDRSYMPAATRQVPMPSQGFRMTVQPMVDQSFMDQFGSQVQARIDAITNHAKTFFAHASLETKFELDIKPWVYYSSKLFATDYNLE